MSTETEVRVDEWLADRVALKAFTEACLVVEEGIAGIRDVDLGMMMGTGMIPGPFARADLRGLDDVLAALETAREEWGEAFEPPLIVRAPNQPPVLTLEAPANGAQRLSGRPVVLAATAQDVEDGNLGAKTGKGFYDHG